MGHEVMVFVPKSVRQWHHIIIGEDEPYVVRCYHEKDAGNRFGIKLPQTT